MSVDEAALAAIDDRIDDLETAVEAAETEGDLDDCEATLGTIREDLEAIEVPEPDDEDEEVEDPREPREDRLDDLESAIEDQRGPYASDVVDRLTAVRTKVADSRFTADGAASLAAVAEELADDVGAVLETPELPDARGDVRLVETLDDAIDIVADAGLDPDADEAAIADLLEAATGLEGGVDAAEAWTDLEIRERLRRDGFYGVLEHVKDFPPELSALKVHEQEGNVDMILLALELFDSDFVEEHCLDALERLGPQEALEPMLELATKRNQRAIAILGTIADPREDVVETVSGYVDANDPLLRTAALRSLGEMGATAATQDVADQLTAEEPDIRSTAARALGLLGDTRAIEPLEAVLADDDEERVRGSAAWALVQIGTADALDAAAAYADDEAFLVQAEARRALQASG